jgi:hypothetical protein
MVAQVGYSVAGQSGGWVIPCAVCTVHMKMESTGFLVEPQNQSRWFVSGLASKLLGHHVGYLLNIGDARAPIGNNDHEKALVKSQ